MKKIIINICFIFCCSTTVINAGWQEVFDTLFGMHCEEDVENVYQTTSSTVAFNTTPGESALIKVIQSDDPQALIRFIKNGFYHDTTNPTNREKKLALLAIEHNASEIFRYLDQAHPNLIMEDPEPFPVKNCESIQYTVRRKSHNNLLEWSLQHKNKTSLRMLLFVMTHCFGCNHNHYPLTNKNTVLLSLLEKAIFDNPLETKFFNNISLLRLYSDGTSEIAKKTSAIFRQFGLISTYLSTAPCLWRTILNAFGVTGKGSITEEDILSIDYQQNIELLKSCFANINSAEKEAIIERKLLDSAISYIFFYTFRNSYKKDTSFFTSAYLVVKKDIWDLYNHLLLLFPENTEKFFLKKLIFKEFIEKIFGKKIDSFYTKNVFDEFFSVKKLFPSTPQEMVSVVCRLEKFNY